MPDNIIIPGRLLEETATGFQSPEKERILPRHVPSPVKAYTQNIGRRRAPGLHWEAPEWDLAECGRIIDTESYVRRAFAVKESLFTKEGWEFIGSNPKRVAYIKKRLRQIEHAGGVPFRILMLWTISSLIRTSNAFWVKKRDIKASGGKVRTNENGKSLKPIAAYFPLPSETVRFKRDEYGKIQKYKQEIRGKVYEEFNPEDVIHFYFNKREGFSVGTPEIVPVKDDIRALRRIEENIELLVYQHLFPLYHYKVGTPELPAKVFPDGTTEVDYVRTEIMNMPSDGCWVTPERHEIEVKGAGGEALNVSDIVEHFKQRIFTGLGVSSVDMGEGGTANRSTAQTMSRNLIDRTKADQSILESFINKFVIEELLMESTFPQENVFDEDNFVFLKFKEIDNEARQALENHANQMYMQNAITHPEMRTIIGKEPFTEEDWEFSYWKQIDEPTKLMQSLDEPYSPEAKAVARANTTSIQEPDLQQAQAQKEKERREEIQAKKPQASPTRKATINKSGGNKNRPENQHGKRSSAKLNKDFYDFVEEAPVSISSIVSQNLPVSFLFDTLREDIPSSIRAQGWDSNKMETLIGMSFEETKSRLISLSKKVYRTGINDTGIFYYNVSLQAVDLKIEKHVSRYVDKLRDNIFDRLNNVLVGSPELSMSDSVLAGIVFDALEHRARMIDESEIMRAYNAGLGDGYKAQGVETIEVVPTRSDACDICKKSTLRWNLGDAIIYEELPPLHPLCRCLLRPKQS